MNTSSSMGAIFLPQKRISLGVKFLFLLYKLNGRQLQLDLEARTKIKVDGHGSIWVIQLYCNVRNGQTYRKYRSYINYAQNAQSTVKIAVHTLLIQELRRIAHISYVINCRFQSLQGVTSSVIFRGPRLGRILTKNIKILPNMSFNLPFTDSVYRSTHV